MHSSNQLMDKINVTDNSFLRQFETEVQGELAKIEYAQQERKIFLTKLVVPKEKCTNDFSDAFIKEVLSIISSSQYAYPKQLNEAFSYSFNYLFMHIKKGV